MGAMERITIDVAADLAQTMRRSVEDGAYASQDEVVADALRDWARARESEGGDLDRLRRLVDEGDASGESIPAEEVWAELEEIISSFERER